MQVNIPISHLQMILNRHTHFLQRCKKTSHPQLMAFFPVNLYLVQINQALPTSLLILLLALQSLQSGAIQVRIEEYKNFPKTLMTKLFWRGNPQDQVTKRKC